MLEEYLSDLFCRNKKPCQVERLKQTWGRDRNFTIKIKKSLHLVRKVIEYLHCLHALCCFHVTNSPFRWDTQKAKFIQLRQLTEKRGLFFFFCAFLNFQMCVIDNISNQFWRGVWNSHFPVSISHSHHLFGFKVSYTREIILGSPF